MLLFVDETENDDYFIVAGLLVETKSDVELAYRRFKKRISNMHISDREKRTVYTEFKSTQLDRHFQKIKTWMLEEIVAFDNSVIYSCYVKKSQAFHQNRKEDVYVLLLSKIAASLEEETEIIYDAFNKDDFESRIQSTIVPFTNVKSVSPRDSRTEPGLQFVDNICSVLRLHRSGGDKNSFYKIIENRVQNV